MKALILAAGFGKRLLPLTKDKPKAMLKIDNKPIIEHTINWLNKNNILDIAINLHYKPQVIIEYLGDGSKFGVNITYSHEEEILGTAGAVKLLQNYLDEDFFIIYGDILTNIDLNEFKQFHNSNNSFLTICTRTKPKEKKYSNLIEINEKKQIINYVEKPDVNITKNKPNIANCGIYYCNKELLNNIPKGFSDFSYDIFPKLIKQKDVFCYPLPKNKYWYEIGRLEKYNKLKQKIEL